MTYMSPEEKFLKDHWPKAVAGVIAVIVLLFVASAAFTVAPDSRAVVFRFGKYNRIAKPGLNFKFPAGVESKINVRTEKIYREVFGFRHKDGKNVNVSSESHMITGDLSVADLEWIVQYKVENPVDYLIKVHSQVDLLRDMAEYSARLVIGDLSLNEVLRNRDIYRADIQEILQKEMSAINSGVKIVAIELNDANVPEPVKASYNAVNEAQQEKERMIYSAQEQYNSEIPEAKGQAQAIIDNAKGQAAEIVNEAEGRVSRFLQLRAEYKKAKRVTATRMYLDTMKDVLARTNVTIVDGEMNGALPLLNLNRPMGGK